MFLKVS